MWRHPIRWLRANPDRADALLAFGLVVITVLFHWITPRDQLPGTSHEASWWGSVLVAITVLPVAWRRRAPAGALLAAVGLQVLCEVVDVVGTGWVGVLICVYSLGAHSTDRWRTMAAAISASVILALLLVGWAIGEIGLDTVVSSSVVNVGAYVLGDNVQKRRQRLVDLAERAERAERERELLARERVRDERSRIARELHDVVAHSVSVMVIQAGAARRQLARDPGLAAAALSTIETTGRQAMDELRRVLGVLRQHADDEDTSLSPQPSLAEIGALVDAADDLSIRLAIEGDLGGVPDSVGLNAYRVVQESLTNVRRHAGPLATVDVSVRRDNGQLLVEVSDNGWGASMSRTDRDGFGLVGMRERVATLGGHFDAGPRPGGGWRVRARFPVST